jgi:hypothetical protein
MTVLHPCLGCTVRDDCGIKRETLIAMRGHAVTAATIRCDLPFNVYFPPGTRCKTLVWDHAEEDEPSRTWAAGTVIKRSTNKRDKLLIHLDTPIKSRKGEDIHFSTAYPKDLQRLDEPRRNLCETCSWPLSGIRCASPICLEAQRTAAMLTAWT